MAYSVQVYEFITEKRPNAIKTILDEIRQNKNEERFNHNIKLKKIEVVNNLVHIAMAYHADQNSHHFDITLRPNDNFLIVQGTGIGRKSVTTFLSDTIQKKRPDQVLTEYSLSIKQMLTLFHRIESQSKNNIIEELIIFFEPSIGYQYHREQYTKLSYKFIANRCASTHADFKRFCRDGVRFEMKMKIDRCVGISDEDRNVDITLEIKSICSFRAYKEIPRDDWDQFCFTILDFL